MEEKIYKTENEALDAEIAFGNELHAKILGRNPTTEEQADIVLRQTNSTILPLSLNGLTLGSFERHYDEFSQQYSFSYSPAPHPRDFQ